MKHIKKYNESNNFREIEEVVKEAFIDFLDSNSAYIEFFDNEKQIFISIDIEKSLFYKTEDEITKDSGIVISDKLESFISYHEYMLDFYKKLEVSINRIKDSIKIKSLFLNFYDGDKNDDNKILTYLNIDINI